MSTTSAKKLKGIACSILSIVIMLALALTITGSPVQAAGNKVASGSPLLASGDLDTTFNGDGKLQTTFNVGKSAIARGVAIQADGKIVAVGEAYIGPSERNFGIARYKAGGGLDTTFSADGKQVIDMGGYYDQGVAVAIHTATGNIIVAGQTCTADGSICDSAVLRLKPGGALDTTFSLDGKRVDDFGGGDNGSLDMALYPDGRILVGGYMWNSASGNYDFALMRYKAGGSLDTTFSSDGKATVAFGGSRNDVIYGLAIQPDGKILAGGEVCNTDGTHCDFALTRLNANGSLDTTFSGDGKQTTNFGYEESAYDLVLQPDGKVVLAGSEDNGSTELFALARYNTNGSLDATFSGDGKQTTNFTKNADPDFINAVAVQPDGKIVACGRGYVGFDADFALARYGTDGNLDMTFSGDGRAIVDFGGYDYCLDLAIQADGKYMVVGGSLGSMMKWSVARILP